MEKITFECESVTPMFISGADGKTPELRSPSIKGAIRFWWRAFNGNMSIKMLRNKESKIFGSATEPVGKSKIKIQVTKHPSNESVEKSLWKEIPHTIKETPSGKKYKNPKKGYEGLSYLLYSVHRLKERPFFKPGTAFTITISSMDKNYLKEAIYSFNLLVLFGALGARCRRGAGSFTVKKVTTNIDIDHEILFNLEDIATKEQLDDYIRSKIAPLILKNKHKNAKYTFSTLCNSEIHILDPKNNWKDALKTIADEYYSFRSNKKKEIMLTPSFGFPIRHRDKSSRKYKISRKKPEAIIMGALPKPTNNNKNIVKPFINRRSSPLIFKIIKTDNTHYFPAIIWLSGELIPENYMIADKKGIYKDEPNTQIIQDFLDRFKNKVVLEL